MLQEKASTGTWTYSDHIFPHDVRQRSLDTGRSRVEVLYNLGIEAKIVKMHKVEDGIETVRRPLNNCWFDDLRCRRGLDALRQYRAEYDETRRTFRLKPVHDWASHAADAFRYGCMYSPIMNTWDTLNYSNSGIV